MISKSSVGGDAGISYMYISYNYKFCPTRCGESGNSNLRDPLISAVKLFVENNKTIMLNEKQNEQPKWKRVFKQKWTKQKEKRSSKWM